MSTQTPTTEQILWRPLKSDTVHPNPTCSTMLARVAGHGPLAVEMTSAGLAVSAGYRACGVCGR